MSLDLSVTLGGFVAWCRDHISGDEKGEAQLYLDHLFRAFGHAGLKEAGASCEEHVKKDGGGTATRRNSGFYHLSPAYQWMLSGTCQPA